MADPVNRRRFLEIGTLGVGYSALASHAGATQSNQSTANRVRMIGDDYQNYPGCQYVSFCANNPSEEVEQVDIMGHCWFFEREWLRAYWAEMPSTKLISGGEDMHFSYALQKHFGLGTYVPPHPKDDKEMWGSLKPSEYGEDAFATSRTGEGHMQANWYWNFMLSQGYKLVKDK